MSKYYEKQYFLKNGKEIKLQEASAVDAQEVLNFVKVIFSESPYI